MKSINNHIYWTAAGSTSGPERIAKWTSILNHVRDVHVHEDPLYPKCEHAIRQTSDRSKWLQAGISPIYRLNVKTVNRQLQLFSGFQKFTRGHGCSILYCMGNGFLISYCLQQLQLSPSWSCWPTKGRWRMLQNWAPTTKLHLWRLSMRLFFVLPPKMLSFPLLECCAG